MQHEEREFYINSLVQAMQCDLNPETKDRIAINPYKPYNNEVVFDLMGKFAIQRRTAKEWLICAQIRLTSERGKDNERKI